MDDKPKVNSEALSRELDGDNAYRELQELQSPARGHIHGSPIGTGLVLASLMGMVGNDSNGEGMNYLLKADCIEQLSFLLPTPRKSKEY